MPDRLSERFTQLSEQLSVRPLTPAEQIRTRGERRRLRGAMLAVIAAAVVVGSVGTLVGLSLSRGSATITPDGPPTPVATAFPDSFDMPHEGEAGWVHSDDPRAPGVFNPCGGADVTLSHRLAAVTMTGPGTPTEAAHSPARLIEQVILFDRPESAEATVHSLAQAATGCGWGAGILVAGDVSVAGDDFQSWFRADRGAADVMLIKDVMVYARGNAVIMKYDESSLDDNAVVIISDRLCATMNLCQYSRCMISMPSPTGPVLAPCAKVSVGPTKPGGPHFTSVTIILSQVPGGPTQVVPSGSPGPGPHYDPTLPPPT